MLRRRFLSVTPSPFIVEDEPEAKVDYTLLRFSRRAMATHFEIDLPQGTLHAADAAEAALDLIDDLEEQLSIYREHSEVSRLNLSAASQSVVVEPRLFALLQVSAALTLRTQGAFDIASGALTRAWGFHRREGRIPSAAEHAAAMQASGMKHVVFNDVQGTIRFRKAGLELNLGSIGKGYALDRAGELLRTRWGIGSALLHAGGSSALALGAPPNDRRGWPIALKHPTDDARTLGTVRVRNRGFATSAATYQHFEYNGRKYGHVLDPRTGWPAETVASVSVLAPTAAEADALATAVFVRGEAMAEAAVIFTEVGGVKTQGFALGEYEPPGLTQRMNDLLTLPESPCSLPFPTP